MARAHFLPALLAAALALTGTAQAQRVIVNPSFESNDPQGPGAANYEIYSNGEVLGWNSVSGEVELWDTGFNSVPAYDGAVFAEMNANVPGALYQNICMVNGETIGWTFAHRARAGGPATQTARFQIANSSGTSSSFSPPRPRRSTMSGTSIPAPRPIQVRRVSSASSSSPPTRAASAISSTT